MPDDASTTSADNVDLVLMLRRVAVLTEDLDAMKEANQRLETSAGGRHTGGMESRMAKVEAAVEHIDRAFTDTREDIRQIRDNLRVDFRILCGALVAGFLILAGSGLFAYNRLDDKIERLGARLVRIETALVAIDAKLDSLAAKPLPKRAALVKP